MDIDEFVRRQNINNFAERLNVEQSGHTQAVLRQLLLEEENRFGLRVEALELLDGNLRRNEDAVKRQRDIVVEVEARGGDIETARRFLDSLTVTRQLFLRYREHLIGSLKGDP